MTIALQRILKVSRPGCVDGAHGPHSSQLSKAWSILIRSYFCFNQSTGACINTQHIFHIGVFVGSLPLVLLI